MRVIFVNEMKLLSEEQLYTSDEVIFPNIDKWKTSIVCIDISVLAIPQETWQLYCTKIATTV